MTPRPDLRLLTIALQECVPALERATFAALPGFDWIGDAADCNDGLRQVLMINPDVIVMPWSAAGLKLIRVLIHLRRWNISPLIVVVTSEWLPCELPPRDSVITVGINDLDGGLAEFLHLLRADATKEIKGLMTDSVAKRWMIGGAANMARSPIESKARREPRPPSPRLGRRPSPPLNQLPPKLTITKEKESWKEPNNTTFGNRRITGSGATTERPPQTSRTGTLIRLRLGSDHDLNRKANS